MIEPEFAYDMVNWKDYDQGKDAGWRGDELVTPKSQDYMNGYEAGQVAREEYNRSVNTTSTEVTRTLS